MEKRKLNKNSYCRVCDKLIEKNTEEIIYFYSWRNRGITVIICGDCVAEIYKKYYEEGIN